jgi:hypothetical protein
MSADQGNRHGIDNLHAFEEVLEDRCSGCWEAANTTVTDAAIARARRWATIQDLQRRIAGLDGDAQNQEDLANDLEHMGKGKNGKNDAISKLMNAIGSVPAVKNHLEAEKDRAEAARLRDELSQIENQSTASVPAP